MVVLGGGLFMLNWTTIFTVSFTAPRGYLTGKTEWPKPFAALFEENGIEIYGLPKFLDDRVIAQVNGHQELIEELVQTHALAPTNAAHPVAPRLHQSLPRAWETWQNSDDDQWYATKNFGSEHLEAQDLFLIVTNRKSGRTLIYYNWIF